VHKTQTREASRVHSNWLSEVEDALRAIGNLRYGEAIRADRRSEMLYFGIGVPELRARVKQGFSFYAAPPDAVLTTWDELWRESAYGDVLFAAIEYYRKAPMRQPAGLWDVIRHWIDRVDNWAHADSLAGLYSEVLERDRDAVYPQLSAWNATERSEWERRISLVSLIHYSGKNAVFMPLELVLPMVSNCLGDDRYYVQTAVGWVLRETGNAYPAEVRGYLEANAARMTSTSLTRAIERWSASEKAAIRALR
jgi:3-methyladenine DNA glycosylase AlkD